MLAPPAELTQNTQSIDTVPIVRDWFPPPLPPNTRWRAVRRLRGPRRPLLGLVEPFQSLDLERLLLDDRCHLRHLLFGRPQRKER